MYNHAYMATWSKKLDDYKAETIKKQTEEQIKKRKVWENN